MLQVKVGNKYLANDGLEYYIVGQTGNIFTDGINQWLEDGTFLSCYEEGNPYFNLVELVRENV